MSELLHLSQIFDSPEKEIICAIYYDDDQESIYSRFEIGHKDNNGDVLEYSSLSRAGVFHYYFLYLLRHNSNRLRLITMHERAKRDISFFARLFHKFR